MSHHFGIRPWDIDKMTYDEIQFYADALKDIQDEARKAARRK